MSTKEREILGRLQETLDSWSGELTEMNSLLTETVNYPLAVDDETSAPERAPTPAETLHEPPAPETRDRERPHELPSPESNTVDALCRINEVLENEIERLRKELESYRASESRSQEVQRRLRHEVEQLRDSENMGNLALQEVRAEVSALKKTLQEREASLEKTTQNVALLSGNLETIREELRQREEAAQRERESVADVERERASLVETLEGTRVEVTDWQERYAALESRYAGLESSLAEVNGAREALGTQLTQAREELDDSRTRLVDLETQADTMRDHAREITEAWNQACRELERIRQESVEDRRRYNVLQREIRLREQEIAAFEGHQQDARDALEQKQSELDAAVEALEHERASAKATLAALERAEANVRTFRTEFERLEGVNHDLLEQRRQSQNVLAEKESEIEILRDELAEAHSAPPVPHPKTEQQSITLEKLRQRLAEKEQQLDAAESRLKTFVDENTRADEALAAARSEVSRLRTELQRGGDEREALRGDIERLRNESEEKSSEAQGLRSELGQVRERVDSLVVELEQALVSAESERKSAVLQEELSALALKYEESNQELARKTQDLIATTEELASTKRELAELQTELNRLLNEIDSVDTEIARTPSAADLAPYMPADPPTASLSDFEDEFDHSGSPRPKSGGSGRGADASKHLSVAAIAGLISGVAIMVLAALTVSPVDVVTGEPVSPLNAPLTEFNARQFLMIVGLVLAAIGGVLATVERIRSRRNPRT